MSSFANPGNFLRTSRNFPTDPQELSVELSKMYIDVATETNARISGIYGTGSQIITSEAWFINGQNGRQFSLRQVYTFTGAGSIPHGINPASISQFTKCSGEYTDGTNWYGVIFASSVTIAGQVSFYVTPTNLVILADGGAPAIVSGTIVLEWLSVI